MSINQIYSSLNDLHSLSFPELVSLTSKIEKNQASLSQATLLRLFDQLAQLFEEFEKKAVVFDERDWIKFSHSLSDIASHLPFSEPLFTTISKIQTLSHKHLNFLADSLFPVLLKGPHGKEVMLPKSVFSSDVVQAMLSSQFLEAKTCEIVLGDITPDCFDTIAPFFKKQPMPISENNISEILMVAHRYNLRELFVTTTAHLLSYVGKHWNKYESIPQSLISACNFLFFVVGFPIVPQDEGYDAGLNRPAEAYDPFQNEKRLKQFLNAFFGQDSKARGKFLKYLSLFKNGIQSSLRQDRDARVVEKLRQLAEVQTYAHTYRLAPLLDPALESELNSINLVYPCNAPSPAPPAPVQDMPRSGGAGLPPMLGQPDLFFEANGHLQMRHNLFDEALLAPPQALINLQIQNAIRENLLLDQHEIDQILADIRLDRPPTLTDRVGAVFQSVANTFSSGINWVGSLFHR